MDNINIDNISIDYFRSLPNHILYFLITVCKFSIYKNIGNKDIISKIYNLFLTFSKSSVKKNDQTEFVNLITFPNIVCKPKIHNYIQSYEELIFKDMILNTEFKFISPTLLYSENIKFDQFNTLYDNDSFTLQNITDTNKQITSSFISYKYKNAKKIVDKLGYRYKYIGRQNKYYSYITDKFEGNLNLLKVRISWNYKKYIEQFISIVEDIRKQILYSFSLNKNYVFANMSLENILYRCNDYEPDQISVYLNIDYSKRFTYPPPEYKYNMYYGEEIIFNTEEIKEQVLSWNIGILLLLLIDDGKHVSNFFYSNVKTHNTSNLEKAKKKIDEFYGKYSEYLNLIPNERPSIYEPLIK